MFGSSIERAWAEVIVTGKPNKEGRKQRIIAGSVKSEDADSVTIEIYKGYTFRIPKLGIANRDDVDRSQGPEREEFESRRKALKAEDVDGYLALAGWAREKGLRIQALGLLLDLKDRHPRNAKILAAFPVEPRPEVLSEKDKAFLAEQVVAFFARDGKPEEVLLGIQGRDSLLPGSAEEWARLCFAEARKGTKVEVGDTTFKNGNIENPLHIELLLKDPAKVPEKDNKAGEATREAQESGGDPKAGDQNLATGAKPTGAEDEPWPVLLSLHGGGQGDGHWSSSGPMYREMFKQHFKKLIFVAPTVMNKIWAEWSHNPSEEFQVREILRAVKRTWNVDTDRVYVAGYSMGGYGAWHIGGHGADGFAGLVSGAGGIMLGEPLGEAWGWGVIGNLMHTPIAFIHGGKDGPAPPWSDQESDRILKELAVQHPECYRHWYKFYPDSGHGLPGEGSAEAVKWVAKFKRNPYPKKICWEPKRDFNRQFYWLRVEKPQIFTRLEAEITDNTVKVTTLNLNGGFSVLLNRHLVDLAKPVTVEVNGKRVFQGPVPETLSTILSTVADRIDERQWFSARIDF